MTRASASRIRRAIALLAMGLLVCLLAACPRALSLPPGTGGSTAAQTDPGTIQGSVDFGDRRLVQTDMGTIATGATIALIRVSNSETVSTTTTDAKGAFSLRLSNRYRPVAGELYYLEAIKGLQSGTGSFNAVGADLARVRTIGRWNGTNWETLTGAVGPVRINQTTTAIAIDVSLRSAPGFGPVIDVVQLLSSVRVGQTDGNYPDLVVLPEAFTSGAHPLMPLSLVHRTIDLVADALAKNRDPVRWIALSSLDPDHNTVKLPDAPFAISYLSPGSGFPGDTLRIVGSNFGDPLSANQVAFTEPSGATVSATVTTVSSDLSQLTVQVPAAAVTGPIYLTIKGKTLPGPIFNLSLPYGHSVVDPAANVYLANRSMGTIAVTQPVPGSARLGVKPLVTGLDYPGALTFGKEGYPYLYVACGGTTRKILKLDMRTPAQVPVASSSAAPFTNPTGMAYQYASGDYFLADATTNQLYRMAASGPTPNVTAFAVTGVTLSQPHSLSFGPDGLLYVANTGANNVLQIDVASGIGSVYLSGLSSPYGVAFDNKGGFYVTNNTGNSVFTVPVTSAPGVLPRVYGPLTSFASIPTPGAISVDPSANLYVADLVGNGIYRANQYGETYQVAYGINYPLSTWVDASGQYVLTQAGRIMKVDAQGVLTVYAEGLTSGMGLVADSKGNFYTYQSNLNAITQIRPDGSAVPIVTGLTECNYQDAGTTITSTLSLRNDRLYIRQKSSYDVPSPVYANQGEVLEYTLVADGSGNFTSATGPTRRLRSPLDQISGVARNTTTGTYYVLQPRLRQVYAVEQVGGTDVTFTLLATDARLTNPQDIWVDSATGRIWIVNDDGGNGNLFAFNPDGTPYTNGGANPTGDYSASVNHPTNLNSDGTSLYVNSYVAAGDIRQLNLATGAVVRTISGFNLPRGFAFDSTTGTMYVNEWGLDRISSLANYTVAATPIMPVLNISDRYDLETSGSALVVTKGASLYKVVKTNGTWAEQGVGYRDNYVGPVTRIFRESNGRLIYLLSGGPQLADTDDGDHISWAGSLYALFGRGSYSGIHGDPTGCGVVTGTTMYANSLGGGNQYTFISEVRLDGSVYRSYRIASNVSGLATNGVDTAYVAGVNAGKVYKISGGRMTTLNGGVGDRVTYGGNDRMYGGLCYYNGFLYEGISTRNWVDKIDVTTGVRTTLLQGLVAPEL